MQSERLTRQELTWLLTQEARSAAEKLRKGVVTMATTEVEGQTIPAPPGIELELDALDEAMKALASLHSGGSPRGRRGRIDLAALVCDIAPSARVSIEPRGGTEVFGDEAELRRMIQVLVGSINAAGSISDVQTPEVSIRRDQGNVRLSVTLGPDSSGSSRTERAWLNRMAVRYGGRLELEGGTESLLLPADGAAEAREVESLRRELEAAQRQGEAYARELAAVFSQSAPGSVPSAPPDADAGLLLLTGFATTLAPQIRAIANSPNCAEAAAEFAEDIERVAGCATQTAKNLVDIRDMLRGVVGGLSGRFARRRLTLHLEAPDPLLLQTRPPAAIAFLHTLLVAAASSLSGEGRLLVKLDGPSLLVEPDRLAGASEAPSDRIVRSDPPLGTRVGSHAGFFMASVLARHLGFELIITGAPARGDVVVRLVPQAAST